MKLSADDLVLGYGQKVIVDNVSITIPEGEVSVLIGPNGSGKSTILRALSRLLKPEGGQVILDGYSIQTMSTKEVARKLAILPQQSTAPEAITVENLVWYGRHPHRKGIRPPTAADREAVDWAIESTGLADLRTRPVDQLSGGQRQRAWIALALAQGTEILLLDEPTTFLDLSHQLDVLELCAELNREQHKTVVMVLHDVNLAAEFSHNLFVINQGRLQLQGSPATVLTRELMRDVFGIKARIMPHPITGCPMCIPLRKVRGARDSDSGATGEPPPLPADETEPDVERLQAVQPPAPSPAAQNRGN
jgi:ABC-type cobalamin/Fe3+-siderophores transport system ATPase subunit